jgi:hypothetical protein
MENDESTPASLSFTEAHRTWLLSGRSSPSRVAGRATPLASCPLPEAATVRPPLLAALPWPDSLGFGAAVLPAASVTPLVL